MIININVEQKHATATGAPVIVCGNSDYEVQFTFDSEWSAASDKVARFAFVQFGKVGYIDVDFTGDKVQVPRLSNIREVLIGVYADGICTTTPARVPCELSILCGTGAPAKPTPSQYEELMALYSDLEARIKYLEKHGGGGSAGNGGGVSDEEKALILTLFKNAAYTSADMGETLAQLETLWSNSGDSGDSDEGGEDGGDSSGSGEDGGGEISDPEWIEVYTIGESYTSGCILDTTTGEVTDDGSWSTSDFIEVPDGATAWSRVTSRESDLYVFWYDANKEFLVRDTGTTTGAGAYGSGYTDADGVVWNMIPSHNAKYVRVSWRYNATYTSFSFKHNTLMTENVTPEYGKVYYYTVPNGSYALSDEYLRCDGMAYAHARPIKRCKVEFYDEAHSLLSNIAVTNNNGNNLAVPSNAKYLRVSNGNSGDTGGECWGLIAFTETEVTTW